MTYRILLDPQGGEGAGNNPDPKGAGDGDAVAKAFQALLAKHNNDAGALATKLFDENHSLREKNRELAAKVPLPGSLVLSGDDVAAWPAYQKLGKPGDLEAAVNEGRAAKADLEKSGTVTDAYALPVSAAAGLDAAKRISYSPGARLSRVATSK